ncbi:hypothetical protein R1sor_017644 [Riccia sorocarpa]|uniref:Uncharacterized protein n=1 Tax=Riccia sorocarpa TaxID=122646 RepID=A0ABD3IA83_9MARC
MGRVVGDLVSKKLLSSFGPMLAKATEVGQLKGQLADLTAWLQQSDRERAATAAKEAKLQHENFVLR